MTMQLDLSVKMIVATNRPGAFYDECKNYGLTGGESKFVLVETPDDIADVLALPAETAWTIVYDISPDIAYRLKNLFGPARTFAEALNMQTDEKVMRGTP